jgi:hypothetical protein
MSSGNHVVVLDGLLVAGGTDALVAFDLRTGARRWTVDLRGVAPDPCPKLAVAPASARLFCADRFGVISERSPASSAVRSSARSATSR